MKLINGISALGNGLLNDLAQLPAWLIGPLLNFSDHT